MKRIASLFLLLLAAPLPAAQQNNAWRPVHTIMEPVCQATDWNQTDALNAYVGAKEFKYKGQTYKGIPGSPCGCDPLAWGQIVTYHALNHGAPSATWEPPDITEDSSYVQNNGARVERTPLTGPFDWAAVRDKRALKEDIPVARLMWNLGILGHTEYAADGGAAGSVRKEFIKYFGFAEGYCYTTPKPGGVVADYWEDMLHRILRVSLQVGAPLGTGIYIDTLGHMAVTDGWGVDENGTEWFHVDRGWGNAQGLWWDLPTVNQEMEREIYPNVFPTSLGSVIVGRVSDAKHAPIANAKVSLTAEDGTVWTTRTDANGCYVFKNLPLVPVWQDEAEALPYDPAELPVDVYTIAVEGAGYLAAQPQTVEIGSYIDDDLVGSLQNAWESTQKGGGKDDGKGGGVVYPLSYGGAVADFVLEPTPKTVISTPNGLNDLSQYAGQTVYVATGTYTLTQPLTIPANTTLIGGYNPATGVVDPLATPTRLDASAVANNGGPAITLEKGAVLDGFALVGTSKSPSLVGGPENLTDKPSVRNCIFVSQPTWAMSGAAYVAQAVKLSTCVFFDIKGATLNDCAATHCSFVGAFPQGLTDNGGNLENATERRPTEPAFCGADHECPAYGLDGRPLGGHLGALAPDSFDFSPEAVKALGYRLRLR